MTPFMTRVIIDEEEYFGQNHIKNWLISDINMGKSKEIIGLRRSGKTSLLKTMENKLRKEIDSKAYPLFLDFTETSTCFGKGTQNVYNYIIACLVSRLVEDGIIAENFMIRGIEIKASPQWEDIFDSLTGISQPKTMTIFEELIELSAEKTKKCILLLFDEYEYLFTDRFDEPQGFMPMRKLNKTPFNGKKIFSYWYTGALIWSNLAVKIDQSPPLNTTDPPTYYLGPLDRESFKEMWNHELKIYDNESRKNFISGKEEIAYKLSGGFPFYGKQIGQHFLTGDETPDNSLFKNHLNSMYNFFNDEEKQFLVKLSKEPQKSGNPIVINDLLDLGIIKKPEQNYEITIPFFKDFLRSHENLNENPLVSQAEELAEKAEQYVLQINLNCSNKQKPPVFEPIIETGKYWKDIKTLCMSKKDFEGFASSLYKLIIETSTTKKYDPRTRQETRDERIPKNFYYSNQVFFDTIETLRHHFSGHVRRRHDDYKDKAKYLNVLKTLLGSEYEPETVEDFQKMQIEVLKMLESKLKDLSQMVKEKLSQMPKGS
ncbi:MAG: hypothetical protein FWG77_04060 [Treponema sp.]|nr:hypothetical protein [Treponema sp.]